MSQLNLDGVHVSHVVRPAEGRTTPQLWVRSIRIVRALTTEPDDVVREVRLRRGLNVVWAPPRISGSEDGTPDVGLAGHTAGKTSFCRLLRYVLGEKQFANSVVRRSIRAKLPEGWVLAEVVVDGGLWGVARPFAIGPHSFAVRDASLSEIASGAERSQWAGYLDAIQNAVLAALPVKQFPEGNQPVAWAHVLPWLTRDQECRFADFLDWRDTSSESDAPVPEAADRQFLARAFLGLIEDAERLEQARNARLVRESGELRKRVPLLLHQSGVDEQRLQSLLGDKPPGIDGLFGSAVRNRLSSWREAVERKRRAAGEQDPRPAATAGRDRALELRVNAQRDLSDVDERISTERATLDQLERSVAARQGEAVFAALPVGRDYCNIPRSDPRWHQCPLASVRAVGINELRAERSPAEDAESVRATIASLEEMRSSCAKRLEAAAEAERRAHGEYLRALTRYDELQGKIADEGQRVAEATRLFLRAEQSSNDARALSARLTELEEEKVASYKRQEALREARRAAYGAFANVFEHVAQRLLGPAVRARIDAAGRSLALHVELNGERASAALETVKLLAFDLAAVTASIEGIGSFPRFLVHDGPREADMARDIYDQIFRYARELEDSSSGEPSFQYVITTTTEPPEEFQSEPWLCLSLSGAASESRLYRTDF